MSHLVGEQLQRRQGLGGRDAPVPRVVHRDDAHQPLVGSIEGDEQEVVAIPVHHGAVILPHTHTPLGAPCRTRQVVGVADAVLLLEDPRPLLPGHLVAGVGMEVLDLLVVHAEEEPLVAGQFIVQQSEDAPPERRMLLQALHEKVANPVQVLFLDDEVADAGKGHQLLVIAPGSHLGQFRAQIENQGVQLLGPLKAERLGPGAVGRREGGMRRAQQTDGRVGAAKDGQRDKQHAGLATLPVGSRQFAGRGRQRTGAGHGFGHSSRLGGKCGHQTNAPPFIDLFVEQQLAAIRIHDPHRQTVEGNRFGHVAAETAQHVQGFGGGPQAPVGFVHGRASASVSAGSRPSRRRTSPRRWSGRNGLASRRSTPAA